MLSQVLGQLRHWLGVHKARLATQQRTSFGSDVHKAAGVSVNQLILQLQDKNFFTRRMAERALEKKLNHPWDGWRAALTLARLGNVLAIRPLVTFIKPYNNTQEALKALEALLEHAGSSATLNDLRAVLALPDSVTYNPMWGCNIEIPPDIWPPDEITSCQAVKNLARQELLRRGLEA